MHELGVAQSVFDIVRQHVPVEQAARVRTVRVAIGELAGVLPESLAFCFEAIVADTWFSAARLALERVPARLECTECHLAFALGGLCFACPACGSARVGLVSGRELQVVDVELADVDDETSIGGEPDTSAERGEPFGGAS